MTILTAIPPPPTPVAAAGVPGGIHITWVENSASEGGFEIRRFNGSSWPVVGTVGPNVTEFKDTGRSARGWPTGRVRSPEMRQFRLMLRRYGYSHALVERSSVPLRS